MKKIHAARGEAQEQSEMKKLCRAVFVLEAKKATFSACLSPVVTFLHEYGAGGRKPTHHLKCSDLYGANLIVYAALTSHFYLFC